MPEKLILVTKQYHNTRIDKVISDDLAEDSISRSYIQKLIKDGLVLVNDKAVKSNYKVSEGEKILINIPEPETLDLIAEDIPLDIIYEDEDVLIINKPKGMVVHPSAGHNSGTLVNACLFHCKDKLSEINGVLRPGIVHRIDMNTTGSLIVCKNNNSHNYIADQLAIHSITRIYRGIVLGVIKEENGRIDAPISRHKTDRKKMAINPDGKDARTNYKVLKRFKNYTYVEFSLETGRTHQIRVHMASIGHPLLGDEVYGPSKCPIKGLTGQTLHAMTIGFIHPTTKKYVEFQAPIPEYFQELLKKLPE